MGAVPGIAVFIVDLLNDFPVLLHICL